MVITAIAAGTGVGVNTLMARQLAENKLKEADKTAGMGMLLALFSWLAFTLFSIFFLPIYINMAANDPLAVTYSKVYGYIVCIGSIGIFLESCWTKVHQASGNMKLPMIAQIAGAVVNIILDPLLIFSLNLGIAGAAIATVAGQVIAAVIIRRGFRKSPLASELKSIAKQIYRLGYPSILLQLLYPVYVVIFNIILSGFSDAATTVLGLYYKLQSFFFIPVLGLQSCIVPVLSYNYAGKKYTRCRQTVRYSLLIAAVFMFVGILCFECFPLQLIGLFSKEAEVMKIGKTAFCIIGLSFLPDVPAMIFPAFFQSIGKGKQSTALIIIRHLVCLIPIFWLMSMADLNYAWFAFPIAELVTAIVGGILYCKVVAEWKCT